MNADTRFRVNTPDVTHEVIDGEAVIINLVTGNYYSLQGEGAEVWSLLAGGATLDVVVEQMMGCYEGDRSTIGDSVRGLVSQLQQEQLILVSNGAEVAALADPPRHTNGNEKPKFRPIVLNRFTDMQELLILDPIHEVDEAGWPHRKTA